MESSERGPLCLHVAEGIDEVAQGEVDELGRRGLLNDRLIAVHGVGMGAGAIARFRRAGAALVWCPTSNNFLFGRTASGDLLRDGIDVLIGSDSRLTGDGDLLDELRAARMTGLVEDSRLADAVGSTASRRLGLATGALEPGDPADLILLRRPLLDARANDVALTMVGGVPRVARMDIARALGGFAETGTPMRIGKTVRWTNPSSFPDRRNFE